MPSSHHTGKCNRTVVCCVLHLLVCYRCLYAILMLVILKAIYMSWSLSSSKYHQEVIRQASNKLLTAKHGDP